MIVRLADAARSALRDPRQVLGPIVEVALALRTRVRAEGRYDLSDLLRDELAAAGVEVRDTADGVGGSQSRFVRAPVSAPCTRRAYLASTPEV